MSRVVLVMGVSGSGKTTVGRAIAAALGGVFVDADSYHPPENVAKMAAGTPLEDADRWPWLSRLRGVIDQHLAAEGGGGRPLVIACSALKRAYRRVLLDGLGGGKGTSAEAVVVYLKGDFDLIRGRMVGREGADGGEHFMKPRMLASQFEALEEPRDGEIRNVRVAVVGIEGPIAEVVERVLARIS